MDGQNGPICYIVGAGDFFGAHFSPRPGDLVIAADGGFTTLSRLGARMDLVVGDFDSMGFRPDHPNVVDLPVEKNDTDTLAALRLGRERGFRLFRIYGGTGGREDHTLANLQSLVWLSRRGCQGWLIGDGWTATAITDGSYALPAVYTGTVSVFCQGDRAEGVSLKGLHYELEDHVLTCDFPLGVSNSFTGQESLFSVRKGTLLILYEDHPENMDTNG